MNSNGGGDYFSLSKAKLKELRQKAAARRSLLNRLVGRVTIVVVHVRLKTTI